MKDSPVVQILKKAIHFEKQGETAVYHQIAHQISEAIQRKIIIENTLLPGTRTLSKLLKIHRNTAVAVYDELALQGWVKIIPKKGTFASNPHQKKLKIKLFQKLSCKEVVSTKAFFFNNSLIYFRYPILIQ